MEFHRILVPVSGTDVDEEAIRLACRLARRDKASILAVYVIPIDRTLPLDAEMAGEVEAAEAILDRMEGHAAEEGCTIETDLLQAREAAPTIVDEAVEREVDLILMGASYKTRFGQFSLGTTIPHVLKHAPCRVILYHQYSPSTEENQ
ncbi:MAG TPA: universal stress protein [Dehalococcoidia bacterium]|nr:universal stress protein [Dehalococcoidia bacterium]